MKREGVIKGQGIISVYDDGLLLLTGGAHPIPPLRKEEGEEGSNMGFKEEGILCLMKLRCTGTAAKRNQLLLLLLPSFHLLLVLLEARMSAEEAMSFWYDSKRVKRVKQ